MSVRGSSLGPQPNQGQRRENFLSVKSISTESHSGSQGSRGSDKVSPGGVPWQMAAGAGLVPGPGQEEGEATLQRKKMGGCYSKYNPSGKSDNYSLRVEDQLVDSSGRVIHVPGQGGGEEENGRPPGAGAGPGGTRAGPGPGGQA